MLGRRNRSTLILLIIMSLIIISAYYSGSGEKIISGAQRTVMSILTPLQRLVSAIVTPFRHGWRYLVAVGRMQDDNTLLKKENLLLRQQLADLRKLRRENTRLQKLVGFKNNTELVTLPAKVIGRSSSSWQAMLVIDEGYNSGIRKNMPVVIDSGVVGQIVEVGSNSAYVLLLNDQKSGIGIELERTGQIGVVEGRIDRELRLKFVPKEADIRVGDRLVTSGIGKVYPRHLLVGVISEIKTNQYGMEKTVKVKSAVDFSKLEEVLIITNSKILEPPVKAVSAP